MGDSLNKEAAAARSDEQARENLIRENRQTILRAASSAAHRYITESDDEWSISLYAFSNAIDSFTEDKGDFLPYACLLIRRSLIDHYRREAKYAPEVSVPPEVMEGNAEDGEENPVYLAVAEESEQAGDHTLREEILSANEIFQTFGFRFFDLTGCSPRQDKTRRECARAVEFLLHRSDLLKELLRTGKLPGREIRRQTGVSGKTLDRYRKYLLAAVIILTGDYPQLAEYLKPLREEDRL